MDRNEMISEELEEMKEGTRELDPEELQKASGGAGGIMIPSHARALKYLIEKWKRQGKSYEWTKEHIIKGEKEEDIPQILEWVDDCYEILRLTPFKYVSLNNSNNE